MYNRATEKVKDYINKLMIAILIIFSIINFSGCETNNKNTAIDNKPERIVSVAPSITELIYALGKGKTLVGRTDYCNYPKEAETVPSVGELINPNIEKMVELNPDLVIATANFSDEIIKKLEELGIRVVILYEGIDLEGAYDSIATLGEVIYAEEEASNLILEIQQKVEEVKAKVKDKEKPKVYYAADFGKNGDYTATGDTFIGQILEIAGGKNIAKGSTGWKYSLEEIIENDPEYILISKYYGMKDSFMDTAGYKELSAVKNNNVIEIDDDILARQGPRLGQAIEELAKIFHPDLFK
jgi:iron complex transport system substrate-binding protein